MSAGKFTSRIIITPLSSFHHQLSSSPSRHQPPPHHKHSYYYHQGPYPAPLSSSSSSPSSSSSLWQSRLAHDVAAARITPSTVASAALANTLSLARTSIESFTASLPSSLQALLPFPKQATKNPYFPFLSSGSSTTTTVAVVASSVLLPLLLLFFFLSMSSWRSYFGGRYSPFTAAPPSRPQVTDADYHYIDPNDIVDPPARDHHHPASFSGIGGGAGGAAYPRSYIGSREHAEDPNAPDILILKHRGTTYPLHFKAYSIGEGFLKVGELRRYAASETGTIDPRRVKLLYKGKVLKDDSVACRDEGLKQNSELMCVVSDSFTGGRSEDETSEESADEEEMLRDERRNHNTSNRDGGPRIDVDGSIIDDDSRKGRRRKDKDGKKPAKKRTEDSDDRDRFGSSPKPAAPTSASAPPTTAPSPAAASSASKPAASSAGTTPKPPSSGPKTAMDQLDELAGVFHTQLEPLCEKFIASPPPDAKTRTQEHLKLSESILAMVILKLDGVETAGDEDARAKRKALVKETQNMLTRIDAVSKPGKKK